MIRENEILQLTITQCSYRLTLEASSDLDEIWTTKGGYLHVVLWFKRYNILAFLCMNHLSVPLKIEHWLNIESRGYSRNK